MVTVLVLGLALAPVVLSTACSTPGASTSADAAAAAVAQDFAVPADAEACLVDRFGSDPGTRRLLTTTSEPTADQRKALGDAVDACVTPDQFALSLIHI